MKSSARFQRDWSPRLPESLSKFVVERQRIGIRSQDQPAVRSQAEGERRRVHAVIHQLSRPTLLVPMTVVETPAFLRDPARAELCSAKLA